MAAETRLDPAELVNAAIDALIRERCELPSLSTLLRLAGNAHRRINSTQWQKVHERLTAPEEQRLDELLTPSADSQDSPFAVMCRGAGKATRDNLKELIAHYDGPAMDHSLAHHARAPQLGNLCTGVTE